MTVAGEKNPKADTFNRHLKKLHRDIKYQLEFVEGNMIDQFNV